jgi:hypothetical protein
LAQSQPKAVGVAVQVRVLLADRDLKLQDLMVDQVVAVAQIMHQPQHLVARELWNKATVAVLDLQQATATVVAVAGQ